MEGRNNRKDAQGVGSLYNDKPATGSVPELPTNIITELAGARPRSWSTQSDIGSDSASRRAIKRCKHYEKESPPASFNGSWRRTASLRSTARAVDETFDSNGTTSRSSAQIASTAFSRGAFPVVARGKISGVAGQSMQPQSSGNSGRKHALTMMKPLTGPSSSRPKSVTSPSNEMASISEPTASGTESETALSGSMNSPKGSSDRRGSTASNNRLGQLELRTEPVVDVTLPVIGAVAEIETTTKNDSRSKRGSWWPATSWWSSTGGGADANAQVSATERLKAIEGKQTTEEPAARGKWGWFGKKEAEEVSETKGEEQEAMDIDTPGETGKPRVIAEVEAEVAAVVQEEETAEQQQQQPNMLLPDLDLIMDTDRDEVEVNTDQGEPDYLKQQQQPSSLLQSITSGIIKMAPEWAQNAWQGQRVADKYGQRTEASDRGASQNPGITAKEQIESAVDREVHNLGHVAVVGIHGWFPTRMVQMISGEPTGKSEKFCLMMREALKEYLLEKHNIEVPNSDISLFPLIGEGRLEDRVELLLSQIVGNEEADSNGVTESSDTKSVSSAQVHKDKEDSTGKKSEMIAKMLMPPPNRRAEVLRSADTVFVVTHSQGTPVSAMLIEQLMELGLVDCSRQRVCMLAMAGISHGPLPYLKGNVVLRYIESEAARELFELMDPSSPQSQRYVAALSTILHKGVRMLCIGSWVDEVVPLYSAILQGVSHPHVYRAVFIDSRHYLDDFLTNLIVFGLRLRNLGIYDHDLLIHLSEVVAGSLWGHSGHSTVYGDPNVYKLALRWLLCTTANIPHQSSFRTVSSVPTASPLLSSSEAVHMSYRPFNATERLNPYYIPWIMRSLWDEPEIRHNQALRQELERLVALFDQWTPETKAGKELKYRLEPVRGAL